MDYLTALSSWPIAINLHCYYCISDTSLLLRSANALLYSETVSGLDQVEQTSQQKPSSIESDCCQDGKLKSVEGNCPVNPGVVSN